jgi:ribosomal protein S18 acetylase RimI-like enzyme
MNIRKALAGDGSAIARVSVDSWRSTYRGMIPDDFLDAISYQQRQEFWQEKLAEDTCFAFVCVNETNEIVGFVAGGQEREEDPFYRGEIYAVYLLHSYQRKGWGRDLILLAAEELARRDYPNMAIWTLMDNPACQFYEALGGIRIGRRSITVGATPLIEVGYGWNDLSFFIRTHSRNLSDHQPL